MVYSYNFERFKVKVEYNVRVRLSTKVYSRENVKLENSIEAETR